MKDSTCAHEYAVTVSNRSEVLDAIEDPVKLWETFKRETLEAAKWCVGWRPRSQGGIPSAETLDSIEKSDSSLCYPASPLLGWLAAGTSTGLCIVGLKLF